MAHFARINSLNIVDSVVVIPDEHEATGAEFIATELNLDGEWIQTSYSHSIRENFAGVGFLYIRSKDVFVEPAPFQWYELDENLNWVCPIGIHPDTGNPLTEQQWEFLDVVYAIRPTYPNGLGPWTPRNENQYEEGLQRANLPN